MMTERLEKLTFFFIKVSMKIFFKVTAKAQAQVLLKSETKQVN